MYPRGFFAIVEVLRQDSLSVSVCEEVDGSRWHDTNEIGTEALKESAGSFCTRDGGQDLEGFSYVKDGSSGVGELRQGRDTSCGASGGEL
jgi:hypothetical protein